MTTEQFIKNKDQILTEYQRQKSQIGDTVASKGFAYEPGFMYKAQNNLETDIKFKVSELNFTLLQEAIERGLKQSGLDYDIEYKNYVIAWELEKQGLMDTWNAWLSNLKLEMSTSSEVVKLLALEVKKRQAVLIDAKTAIEIEAEAVRKQIADLDGTTGDYEVTLAEAKVLTAERKLAVIPYIEQLIVIEEQIIGKDLELLGKENIILGKEEIIQGKDEEIVGKNQELIGKQGEILDASESLYDVSLDVNDANTDKLDAQQDLIDAETEAVNLRASLVEPALETLIETMGRYVSELATQLALYEEISVIKVATATIKEQMADAITIVLNKRMAIAEATSEIATLLSDLASYKIAELAPVISELVNVYDRYADEVVIQTALKVAIADIKKLLAELIPLQVTGELDVSSARTSLENANAANDAAKLAIQLQSSVNRLAVAVQQESNVTEYSGLFGTAKDAEYISRQSSFNTAIGIVETREALTHGNDIDNAVDIQDAHGDAAWDSAYDYEDMKEEMADIKTTSEGIKAQLTHLLSQD